MSERAQERGSTSAEQLAHASAERLSEAPSRAIGLARELARLGAESLLAEPSEDMPEPHHGFAVYHQRWLSLGDRMRDFAACPARMLRDHDRALRERLLDQLGLGPVGAWLVLLSIAAELHVDVAAALSLLAEDQRVLLPTPTTLARLLSAALALPFTHTLRECLGEGPARRLGLLEALELVPGRPLAQQGLRLRERELATLLALELAPGRPAQPSGCEREAPISDPVYPQRLVAGAARLLHERGLICLRCGSARAGRQFALDLASLDARGVVVFGDAEQLPSFGELAHVRAALRVIDLRGRPGAQALPLAALQELSASCSELVVLVRERSLTGRLTAIDVPPLDVDQSQRVWASLGLDERSASTLGERFRVGVDQARAAEREAGDRLALAGISRAPTVEELSAALCRQGARLMGQMVTQLRSDARLDRLIVPDAVAEQLHDIVAWHRASASVERLLGERSRALGRGLTCLFSGPPGTGKTFAAQCLANELGLNLYRIDLSQVVSKWLGETEKALAQVFDEAEAGHGVLLFDEADALFGKRTEVKDAHDRYANVEVGYLLQRMESFAGVAILTTNLRSNIDDAFVRRLRFVIEFPMPDAERRASLWAQALPGPRVGELDLSPFVSRFRLTGGHIHNIALAATHMAAAHGQPITARELVRATYRELEKAGFARSHAEFGPLARWLGERARAPKEVPS